MFDKIKKKNKPLIFILFAIFFVISNSTITLSDGDSQIFLTIGKFWAQGKIPYADLFDHKGPFIFWIDMLSFIFTKSRYGVLFFEILSISITVFFFDKIAYLYTKNDKKSIIFSIFSLLFLTLTFEGGNLTEEYCLPFLTVSLYFTLQFIEKYKTRVSFNHNLKHAFFYGITFSICLLTRVTNAISLALSILIIMILLIKEKNFKNLFNNMFSFILGFSIIFLPFAIYFKANNIFYEFLEGTLLFNTKYAISNASWVSTYFSSTEILYYLIYFFSSYIIIVPSLICLKKKQFEKAIFYLMIGIFETILFMSGILFPHYSTIALPNILITILEIETLELSAIKNKIKYFIYAFLALIFIGLSLIPFARFVYHTAFKHEINYYNEIISEFSEADKKSFIAVNCDYKRIYIDNNICPYYKYFVLQDWQTSNSKQLYDEVYETFNNGDVKWILIEGDESKSLIYDILMNKYEKAKTITNKNLIINLYKIKGEN